MSRRTLLAAVATVVGFAAFAGPSAAVDTSYRPCKDVVYSVNGSVYARTYALEAKNVGCTTARTVARSWLRGSEGADTPRPLGYRCRLSAEISMTCKKSGRTVRWTTVNRFG